MGFEGGGGVGVINKELFLIIEDKQMMQRLFMMETQKMEFNSNDDMDYDDNEDNDEDDDDYDDDQDVYDDE
ncbi:MAG: hypothetical protein EZS28_000368 [Streblomastix strix]|uniref:Uncharacterized protein n=1 Tax=Streblomastix strix TaxID=222440 RepID=A0A5J4XAD7_9EUKA|nr:MAG: hypothetical protein EZS28_000368 [Streblomastix strix]